jgi:hypothetical protein
MKTLRIRLPDALAAQVESEARARKLSISAVVRERLAIGSQVQRLALLGAISDLIGSVDGLEADLSTQRRRT